MGIEAGYDFSDENETEEKIPDLNQMEPINVKEEVEKLVKELKGTTNIGHFEKKESVKLSKDLLNYVRLTWENETENQKAISKEIYSGMSHAGFMDLVKTIWNVKSKEKVDLDNQNNHANFSLVI